MSISSGRLPDTTQILINMIFALFRKRRVGLKKNIKKLDLDKLFGHFEILKKSQKCFLCLKSVISKLIIHFRKSAQRARRTCGVSLLSIQCSETVLESSKSIQLSPAAPPEPLQPLRGLGGPAGLAYFRFKAQKPF